MAKLFNLVVRCGQPEIMGPFANDGERITDARQHEFAKEPHDDYIFRLGVDHNGNPVVTEFSEEELNGEEEEMFFDDGIDNPHGMDDAYHGLEDGFGSDELDAEV